MGGAANGTVPARPAGESAIAPVASRYRRREPERTLLHATVRAHWKTFLAEVEEGGETGASLPRFVVGEFARDSWQRKPTRGPWMRLAPHRPRRCICWGPRRRTPGARSSAAAYLQGFSLHAAVHLHANDREGLAHLCGCGARPPFSQERLSELPDGRLAYRLKRPLGDGRQVLLLQPTELLRRLATLVPPPRAHLVRYHGLC